MTEEGFLDMLGKMAVTTPTTANVPAPVVAPAPVPSAPVAPAPAPAPAPASQQEYVVPPYASLPTVTTVPDDSSSSISAMSYGAATHAEEVFKTPRNDEF